MHAQKTTIGRARELRRRMTLPEVVLWQAMRKGRLAGLRFRRQHPIGIYVLDFYCSSACLAVEVDGAAHDAPSRLRHDARRDAWLARQGVTVLRFAATDVLNDNRLEGILIAIEQAAAAVAPSTASGGPPPPAGEDQDGV
jgi:very-short-patch-repair endonuclease